VTIVAVVVILLLVAGFAYFQYEWSKVASSPCTTCIAAANGQPYDVLLIGSDSRADESASQAQQFGSASTVSGQRSDTIKIIRVDPATGTASSLSIPRDTYVTLSGMPAGSPLTGPNKINAAFGAGPDALVKTIENTFGIPISHYLVIDFSGLEDMVNAVGGISMDVPYPVRDEDCTTGVCNNNAGLAITTTGCQAINGQTALALSRSRYFQYYENGQWISDPTSDIGRIERQNLIISALMDKAKSTYNPLQLNALFTSAVHDFSKDDGLTAWDLFSLVERYHAFSGSSAQDYTLPTVGGSNASAGDVEVIEPEQAAPMISQFLGGDVGTIATPPLDQYDNPITLSFNSAPATQASPPSGAGSTTATAAPPASSGSSASPGAPATSVPPYDPRPC
jgi:LCP family protein required for cell wall assembly